MTSFSFFDVNEINNRCNTGTTMTQSNYAACNIVQHDWFVGGPVIV